MPKSFADFENQIQSLLKSISRAEKIIEEKEGSIRKDLITISIGKLSDENKQISESLENLKIQKDKLDSELNQKLSELTLKSDTNKNIFNGDILF